MVKYEKMLCLVSEDEKSELRKLCHKYNAEVHFCENFNEFKTILSNLGFYPVISLSHLSDNPKELIEISKKHKIHIIDNKNFELTEVDLDLIYKGDLFHASYIGSVEDNINDFLNSC